MRSTTGVWGSNIRLPLAGTPARCHSGPERSELGFLGEAGRSRSLRPPLSDVAATRLEALLRRSLAAAPTYSEVGATRPAVVAGAPMPEGYHHLRYQRLIGMGRAAFEAAGECVLTWGTHRGVGFELRTSEPRAVEGATIAFRIGRGPLGVLASCRVVWTIDTVDRRGFGYATLPEHPENGEEAFVVSTDSAGRVWAEMVAFSNPGRWYSRLAAPAVPVLQRVAVAGYARALERAAASAI
jgi:uncharacterized protein (UPF0548 family)